MAAVVLGALAVVALVVLTTVVLAFLMVLAAVALDALAAVAFGDLVARGMVIFPYGKGNSTILTSSGRAAKEGPNPRAEKLPDNR